MAHTPVTFHPDQPPGTWQRCGEPPGGDPYYNMSNIYSGDGKGSPPPITDSPNADSYHNMGGHPWTPMLNHSGDGVSKNPRTLSEPVSGSLSSADSPPWRRAVTYFPNLKCGLHPQPVPPTITAGSTVPILFSSPRSNSANLQHSLRKLNINVEAYDLVDGSDLADDAVWGPIKRKLKAGFYAAIFASPPCNSFSRLRGSDTTGPQRVRSVEGKERYGLDSNSPADKEYVRLHNLFAKRCVFAFETMISQQRVAVLEQPGWRKDEISMLNSDEFTKLLAMPGVNHTIRPNAPSVQPLSKLRLGLLMAYRLKT